MHFLEYYYKKVIKYDFINKFEIKHVDSIPKIKKITLNFSCINSEIIKLLSTSLFLELITSQKPFVTFSKKSNIIIKIKKGSPTGCSVTLENKYIMYQFFFKLIAEILPKIKNLKKLNIKQKKLQKTVTYSLEETLLIFSELKEHYHLFSNKIPKLDITVVTNSKSQKEFIYLISSFKLPIFIS